MLPNFLILGAPKAGTTSLYRYLKQHPQVFMSPAKEPNYFAFAGNEPSFQGPGDRAEPTITQLPDYEALFAQAGSAIARGEASTVYLYSPTAAARIYALIPEVKLVAILRDPVDRAFSNYMHLRRSGRETIPDFADAIAAEPERIVKNWKPFWFYRAQGLYYVQLQRYLAYFAREQLHLWLFEDFQRHPQQILRELFQVLGADPQFEPDMTERVRVMPTEPKHKIIDYALNQPSPLKSLVKTALPVSFRQQLRDKIHHANQQKRSVSPIVRQQLIDFYRDDILKLQDFLDRDLSNWLV